MSQATIEWTATDFAEDAAMVAAQTGEDFEDVLDRRLPLDLTGPAPGSPPCLNEHPDGFAYVCTRRAVHGGRHAAGNGSGRIIAVWSDPQPPTDGIEMAARLLAMAGVFG